MKLLFQIMLLGVAFFASNVLYAVQACNENILKNKPNSIYTDNINGTITDTKTGLIWQKCSLGQSYSAGACTGAASNYTWLSVSQEIENINQMNLIGHNDWRLPNKNELASLVEVACSSPAINISIFPATAVKPYWTSTPKMNVASHAWFVDFIDGQVNYGAKNSFKYARLVRGGN